MIKLSIVLPCYNVSQYVERCFDSIYSQNPAYSFEVIAVNDASTDDTLCKLYKLSEVYPNVVVVNKEVNGKLTSARSSGIMAASGEYIMQVDPDDYLLPDSLNPIFSIDADWDILFMNILCQQSNQLESYTLYKMTQVKMFDLSIKKDRNHLFEIIKGSCFAKVIKSSLCRDLIYSEYHYNIGEDFALNFETFNRAQRVLYIPTIAYSYQYNPESLARSRFNEDRLDVNDSWISNVRKLLNSSARIYPESKKEITKNIERYSVGLLLKIIKEPETKKFILLNKWKTFFAAQLDLYGQGKRKWYQYLLSMKLYQIYVPMFFVSLGQMAPFVERIKRLFRIYS